MYLLDTNIISELRKNKPHGAVIAWTRTVQGYKLFLSAVTFGEIQSGIERLRPRDPEKATELETWIEQIAYSYEVLSMDIPVFREWAQLMKGQSEELVFDAMLAATARIHRLTLVTRNTRDFQSFDVPLLNPFTGRP